jgi:hypothetical protein
MASGNDHLSGTAEDAGSLGFDTSVAHPARIWDYLLGGKDNFTADRIAANYVLEATPVVAEVARADRAFLASVVRHLAADLGIRQFLDIGTGLPTANNTHEVAQRVAPDSRVVYVDNDPIVLAHARALLTSDPRGTTAYIDADARDTAAILDAAGRTLDFSQPVAVMFLGILLFIPDADEPWAIPSAVMDAVPGGSYLAISHGASDISPQAVAAGSRYNEHSAVAMRLRTQEEFTRFFDGLDLVDPGVVPINHWQPGRASAAPTEAPLPAYAALGRKRALAPLGRVRGRRGGRRARPEDPGLTPFAWRHVSSARCPSTAEIRPAVSTTSRCVVGLMLGWKRTSGMVTVRLPTIPAAPNTGADVPTAPGSFSPLVKIQPRSRIAVR